MQAAHCHHLRLQSRAHHHPRPVVYIVYIVQVPRPNSPSTVEASPLFLQAELHNPQILVGHEVVQILGDIARHLNLRWFPNIVLTHAVLDNRDDEATKKRRGWRFSLFGASWRPKLEFES